LDEQEYSDAKAPEVFDQKEEHNVVVDEKEEQ